MTPRWSAELDSRKPFTRKSALALGMPLGELLSDRYRRIFHGIYVASRVELTVEMRARAALLVASRGSYASHHTAIALWGGWAPLTTETHVSSLIPSTRSERRGIVSHAADPAVVPMTRLGLAVSPPGRAFVELAATRASLVDLVTAGDSLVRAGAVTPEELVLAADSARGRWCKLARRAARLVREGVDSVMESRVRMMMIMAGLPEPTVNHVLRDEYGEWRARFDLCYLGLRVVVEYDGQQHLDTRQRRKDLLRREQLEREGWLFVVLVSDDVYVDPAGTVERIRRAMIERGGAERGRRLSPEWRRCFAGRPAA